jgi:MSHA biogenesis protein MshI
MARTLFGLKSRLAPRTLSAVGLHADGVSLATVTRNGERARLSNFELRAWRVGEEAATLKHLAHERGLRRARLSTWLKPGDYRLSLASAPEVPREEMHAAMRWRVQELIDFPAAEAVYDVFTPPPQEHATHARDVFVVAARNQVVNARVKSLREADMTPTIVDIPEMALRNLATLSPHAQRGVAILSLRADSGLIALVRGDALCLSRTLETGARQAADGFGAANAFDRIVLELQRSLDFYEAHFRFGPPAAVLVLPGAAAIPGLLAHLRANLGLPIEELALAQLMDVVCGLPTFADDEPLLTLGAALRVEDAA